MSDEQSAHPDADRPDAEHEEEAHPYGTVFILMIFITVLAGMWGAMYLTLLQR